MAVDSGAFQSTSAAAGSPKQSQQPIPPPVTSDNKLILQGRIQNPKTALSLFQFLWFGDFQNMRVRALIARALDGFPPLSDANNARLGQRGKTNVNWGHVRRAFQEACMPFNDILESMFPLMYVPTNYGTDEERDWIEPILAEEISRCIRNWSKFNPLWQQTVRLFISEGVGIEMWTDEWNWQWIVKGMQDVKFPRRVAPFVDAMDVVSIKVDELTSDLFKYIMFPARADKLGWNSKAVQESILKAVPLTLTPSDLEQWEKIAKNLDILPQQTAPMVETIHTIAKELDGTMSHYISRYDGEGPWLYERIGKYREASRFMVLYTYDVGTNGDLHSIRGLCHHLFNPGVTMDLALSAAADAVIRRATAVVQGAGEDALNSMPYRSIGSEMVLNEGWEFVDQKTPPFQETFEPWYQTIKNNVFDPQRGDYFSGSGAQTESREKGVYVSDKQSTNNIVQGSQFTASAMNLFFTQKQCWAREVVRRLIRKSYRQNEPGGREAWDLRNRLKKRGVPLEALYQADIGGIEINTGIGRGSLNARRAMFDTLMSRFYQFDAKAQNLLLREWATIYSNARKGRELVPTVEGARPPHDLEDANNENTPLMSMNPLFAANIQVLPNQNHEVHCESHIQALTRIFQANAQGQDPNTTLMMAQPLHAHATQHLEMMAPSDPATGEFKATLEQMNEFLTNQAKRMAAQQLKMQQAQAQGAPANGNGAPAPQGANGSAADNQDTPGLLREAVEAEDSLQFNQSKRQLDLQQSQVKLALLQQQQAKLTQEMQISAAEALKQGQPQ